MNDNFGRNNWFYKTSQRSREYSSGQYISVIDQVELAQKQNKGLDDIRTELVNFYKGAAPQLFEGLRVELGELNSGIQESISEHNRANGTLDQILYSVDDGFESVSARLDKGNSLLGDIRGILSKPVETQAAEFLKRGMHFFADGLYQEAHDDFEEVVNLDIANFVAWYLIGVIRFEQFEDVESALEAFIKCDRYASKRGLRYFSKSLYQQALINSSNKELDDAQSLAEKSYVVDVNNHQACFLVAKLAAERGDLSVAQEYLKRCEVIDVIFYYRSATCTALVESGVHDSVYNEATQKLIKFNNETLNNFNRHYRNIQIYREYADYLIKESYPVQEAIDTVEIELIKLINIPEVPEKNDYLLMLGFHDAVAKEAEKIKPRLSKAFKAFSKTQKDVHAERQRQIHSVLAKDNSFLGFYFVIIGLIVGIWMMTSGAILYGFMAIFATPYFAVKIKQLIDKNKAYSLKARLSSDINKLESSTGFAGFKSAKGEVSKISTRKLHDLVGFPTRSGSTRERTNSNESLENNQGNEKSQQAQLTSEGALVGTLVALMKLDGSTSTKEEEFLLKIGEFHPYFRNTTMEEYSKLIENSSEMVDKLGYEFVGDCVSIFASSHAATVLHLAYHMSWVDRAADDGGSRVVKHLKKEFGYPEEEFMLIALGNHPDVLALPA